MKHTTYTTIETTDGKYKLSALWYYKTNEFKCVSLEFDNNYWDNPFYLLNTVYPFLQKKYDKILSKDVLKELKKDIPKEYRKELKGIIKQGIKLGFFKEVLDESNT